MAQHRQASISLGRSSMVSGTVFKTSNRGAPAFGVLHDVSGTSRSTAHRYPSDLAREFAPVISIGLGGSASLAIH